MRFLSAFLIATMAIPAASFAQSGETRADQNPLKLSGSVRARYEAISGQPRAGLNDSDDLYSLRTILTANYDASDFRLMAELYDSRVYGFDAGTPVTTGESNALELVQANISTQIADPIGKGSTLDLRFGRFTLNMGSRRLVSSDDYRNTTNGYTGLRADLSDGKGTSATFIYTLPQHRLPDDAAGLRDNKVRFDRESFDLVLWGGLIEHKKLVGAANGEISFYHLGEHDGASLATRNRSLDTIGLRLFRDTKPNGWDYEVEGIYQFGSARNGVAVTAPLRNVSAAYLHADIGYNFADLSRLSLEFDYASGDRGEGSNNRFDTLIGSRRPEWGPAGLYSAISRTNIISPLLRYESAPKGRFDWLFQYRPMWLASRTDAFATTGVRDAAGNSGRFAGHQFDLRMRYWLVPKSLRFEFDGLLLAKGRFLEVAPNAPRNGDTRYASFNLTYSF